MTSLRRRPPWIWLVAAAGVMAIFLVLGALAASSLRQVAQSVTTTASPCAPAPCAAPNGFEVKVSNQAITNGVVSMDVTFKNGTRPDAFEAVSYRHTSPADFRLRAANGQESSPMFNERCQDWRELNIKRGATAGPKPLCFKAPSGSLRQAEIVWSPDLGLLFNSVRVTLFPSAVATQ